MINERFEPSLLDTQSFSLNSFCYSNDSTLTLTPTKLQFLIESIEYTQHTITHMTLSEDYKVPVKVWLSTNDNMIEECRGQEREDIKNQLTTINRREKDQRFPDLDEDARWNKYRTEKQIERLLNFLLLANRNGIINPEKTRFGCERGLVGEEISFQGERCKAANAANNAMPSPVEGKRKNFEPHMH